MLEPEGFKGEHRGAGCLPFESCPWNSWMPDFRYPSPLSPPEGCRRRDCCPGNHGVVEETNQYIGLKGLNLEEHFRRLVPIPMTVGNDMNFLTMGCWAQKHPDAGSLVTLFMGGNGIGGGWSLTASCGPAPQAIAARSASCLSMNG